MLGVSLLNLFPLPREAGFRRSFAYAGEAVDRGYSVLVFPEGRHTTDGKMCPFRAGVGLLAGNLGIPVLPMRIDGLFEVKNAGRRFAAPWKISVRIGEPMKFMRGTDPQEIAAELQRAVERALALRPTSLSHPLPGLSAGAGQPARHTRFTGSLESSPSCQRLRGSRTWQ